MSNRARKSKRPSWLASDGGATFLGSRDFPRSLVASAAKRDPKGMLFGTEAVPTQQSLSQQDQARLRAVLDRTLAGKRLLLCSGADDKLVPYACSEPFLDFLKQAAGGWYADGDVVVDDRLYKGVGHAFAPEMMGDAVHFLVEAVAEVDNRTAQSSERPPAASKM